MDLKMITRKQALGFTLSVLAFPGCYQFVPVNGEAIPELGSDVKVELEPKQDIELGALMVRDVQTIEGYVYSATQDSLTVSSVWIRSALGHRYYTNGDVYYLDRSRDLAVIRTRQVHPARTVIALVGGTAVALGLFSFVADVGGDPVDDPGGGDVNPNVVAPVIR